ELTQELGRMWKDGLSDPELPERWWRATHPPLHEPEAAEWIPLGDPRLQVTGLSPEGVLTHKAEITLSAPSGSAQVLGVGFVSSGDPCTGVAARVGQGRLHQFSTEPHQLGVLRNDVMPPGQASVLLTLRNVNLSGGRC